MLYFSIGHELKVTKRIEVIDFVISDFIYLLNIKP
jgi:hypothetical protein